MWLELPSREDEDVWIRAGAAAFLALRYWKRTIKFKIFMSIKAILYQCLEVGKNIKRYLESKI